jgi:hypothetical protein
MVDKDIALELKMVNTINLVSNLIILFIFAVGLVLCLVGFMIIMFNSVHKRQIKKRILRENSEKKIFINDRQESKSSINIL